MQAKRSQRHWDEARIKKLGRKKKKKETEDKVGLRYLK